MKVEPLDPPRRFMAGKAGTSIADCARIRLDAGEQVTFLTEEGSEYDVARQPWGFYATPSLNVRLPEHGLRPALVCNPQGRYFVLLIERGKDDDFAEYLRVQSSTLICWLDDTAVLDQLARSLGTAPE